MDLFDVGKYFQSYVPVIASYNSLLKHATCAYAAKQIGRVKGVKPPLGGLCSRQAKMELWPEARNFDWFWLGAHHYDKAISLLMEALNQESNECLPGDYSNNMWGGGGQDTEDVEDFERRAMVRLAERGVTTTTGSDELLAATTILCGYEFIDASNPAWARHLNGTKSLLDIAQGGMMPLRNPSRDEPYQSPSACNFSKARQATFWTFARQDCIAARK